MKLTIKRDLLVDCLTRVGKVVTAKPSIPILGGFLISVTKDELRITGSNSTETIIHSIPVDGESLRVEESGRCVLPKAVESIFKKCNKELTLSFDGLHGVVTSGKRQTELVSLDAEEYPKIQIDTDSPIFSVSGEQFKDLVRKTVFAASTSETRPILHREEFVNGLEYIKEVSEGICKLELNGMVMTLSSNGQSHVKGIDELIPLSFEGDELSIGFNIKFALDALKAIDTKEVTLYFQGAMRPFLIKPTESDMEEVQLILPIRSV